MTSVTQSSLKGLKMDYQTYSIRKILDSVNRGEIRIPAFQRGFVWEMDRVAHLLDSIYKGYPFGSLLFWRTKQKLEVERKLGTFMLPEPQAEYPIDYVLDGQQRLTSIFTVFQTELSPQPNPDWKDIYFDLEATDNPQNSVFVALESVQDEERARYFPMRVLFDSVMYRASTDHLEKGKIEIVDKLQEKFKEVTIPVQILNSENRSIVAIVFERINHLGVALDTLQLLSAWTWSEDFDLLDKFRDLRDDLSEFGFGGVGDDSDLILSCVAGILAGEPGPETLLDLNGADVRAQFPLVENGIRGAIDFLRTELRVVNLKVLPYPSMLVPLSVFFAEPDGKDIVYSAETLRLLKKWFWRTCLSARYSSQTRKTTIYDIEQVLLLKQNQASNLGEIDLKIEDAFFNNTFRIGAAATKTFVLMLSNNSPKSFLSGKNIELEKTLQGYNRSEFHHIYPRGFLRDSGFDDDSINRLVNFCFLSAAENRKIGKKRPSVYIKEFGDDNHRISETLASAFCVTEDFQDNYSDFIQSRMKRLIGYAEQLIA